eukprot:TRINITY_DN54404_c0_g1_i1.p1 TRINITY_DN54404_c0_g1~~TRINITY_DN54404_c0_g1_i1.p1  ORF type:complete len:496 (-),score=120.82 TRINITY_DN54404_c0_g1_i1:306-1793(-)
MVKKKAATEDATNIEELLSQAEGLRESGRLADAFGYLDEAVTAAPTRQAAWYSRGTVAAELWEEAASSSKSSNEAFLRHAVESFRRVLQLDTSKRSELRYLSALAVGRLMTKVAEFEEDRDAEDGSTWIDTAAPFLTEAVQGFAEAERLMREWGHVDIGSDGWGSWGSALALEMKRQIEAAAHGRCNATGLPFLTAVARLCDEACAKFDEAVTSRGEGNDGTDEDDEMDDLHWMTLHVEHLLAFVSFGVSDEVGAIASLGEAERREWSEKVLAVWRAAVRLANALIGLSNSASDWKCMALKGDVLATGCRLLGSQLMAVSHLKMPRVLDALPMESAQMDVDIEEETVDELRLGCLAEASYADALARGGEECASTVNMSLGEVLLGLARRCLARPQEPRPDIESFLQRSVNAFQVVAACRDVGKDEKAAAWYNMACAAGLAGKPDPAAKALQTCFKLIKSPASRLHWMKEAAEDADLSSVRSDSRIQEVLRANGAK